MDEEDEARRQRRMRSFLSFVGMFSQSRLLSSLPLPHIFFNSARTFKKRVFVFVFVARGWGGEREKHLP